MNTFMLQGSTAILDTDALLDLLQASRVSGCLSTTGSPGGTVHFRGSSIEAVLVDGRATAGELARRSATIIGVAIRDRVTLLLADLLDDLLEGAVEYRFTSHAGMPLPEQGCSVDLTGVRRSLALQRNARRERMAVPPSSSRWVRSERPLPPDDALDPVTAFVADRCSRAASIRSIAADGGLTTGEATDAVSALLGEELVVAAPDASKPVAMPADDHPGWASLHHAVYADRTAVIDLAEQRERRVAEVLS